VGYTPFGLFESEDEGGEGTYLNHDHDLEPLLDKGRALPAAGENERGEHGHVGDKEIDLPLALASEVG